MPREGVELLNTSDGGVFDAFIETVFVEGSIDLTSAENDSVNLLRFVDGSAMFGIGNDPLELRITSKFFNG